MRTATATVALALPLLLLAAGVQAAGIHTATYLPLQDGNSWTYQTQGGGTNTDTVLGGTVSVNAIPTKVVQSSDGSQTFFTNDASGIRQHRMFDPALFVEDAGTFAAGVTFSPPFTFVAATATLGQTVSSNGTATFDVNGLSFPLSYSVSSTLQALETVTVPYGTFTAVKIVATLAIAGMVLGEPISETATMTLWVADHIGVVKVDDDGDVASLSSTNVTPPSSALSSSVLPGSRAVQTGQTATAFATILAAGTGTATGCRIAPAVSLPATTFLFVTTDPATNAINGTVNEAADIPAGAGQSFLIAFTPGLDLPPTTVPLYFDCDNTGPVAILPGVNTLLLSASSTARPDIIALAATPTGDGILNLPGPAGAAAFAAAIANVGAAGTVTATVDTTVTTPGLLLTLCQTGAMGLCTNPATPGASATLAVTPGQTATFSVFAQGLGTVPFDPAANRIVLHFVGPGAFGAPGNVELGATSVAVRTVP